MSHFYANIQGNRGEATRSGSRDSGISGHIRGWHNGIRVEGNHSQETDKDEFIVYATHGSNGGGQSREIARIVGDKVTLSNGHIFRLR